MGMDTPTGFPVREAGRRLSEKRVREIVGDDGIQQHFGENEEAFSWVTAVGEAPYECIVVEERGVGEVKEKAVSIVDVG